MDTPGCDCKWVPEQDCLHWGYNCACYDRGVEIQKTNPKFEVVYRVLMPPCAHIKGFMKKCPGALGECIARRKPQRKSTRQLLSVKKSPSKKVM